MGSEDALISLAQSQNTFLEKRYSTQGSKYSYKTQQISSLNSLMYILIWVYLLVCIIYMVFLFVGPNAKNYSLFFKIIVIIILIVYPYVIYAIEVFLVKAYTFIVEMTVGQVFQRPDHEYVIDYTYMPLQYIPNMFVPA
jgi:uncharacterized membrane protein